MIGALRMTWLDWRCLWFVIRGCVCWCLGCWVVGADGGW